MTLSKLKFKISPITLLAYELTVLIFQLDGLLCSELLLIGLVWIPFFVAFFKANNTFVTAAGFILIAHTIPLFIKNYCTYSEYNCAILFFIGVYLYKEVRQMSHTEIWAILYPKKKVV